ncbi:MAG: NADH-quinone oxidoreductase subunit NuoK [Desulfobacterales bacterium]|nr:NADH-quinone oxidoreductase subunit NuoK [Desulfobacterales bacterium]
MTLLSTHLYSYLFIAIFLFATGLYGMIQHRSIIGMLISTELILSGAGLNFMAFNRFITPDPAIGQIFTLFIMGIAAAEAAIVISFSLAVYRRYQTIDPESVDKLRY